MADTTANLPPHEPAMPAPERDGARLADEIAKLVPILYRTDASPQLSAMLNIIARAKTMGQDGYRMLEGFANRLKQLRAFDDLYVLTSEMNADGLSSPKTRRLEIQALIELGVFETALDLVRPLLVGDVTGTDDAAHDVREAYGLLGRIYKQMFIEGIKPDRKTERETLELFLTRSFNAYIHVWEGLQNEATTYHAVNALAVAQRAMQQGFADEEDAREAQKLANDILGVIAKSGTNDVWADATRGEALVALGRHAEAAQAYAEFAQHPQVDPFSLGASLRQLEEVWELNGGDPIKGKPVRILKAAMLGKLDDAAKANSEQGKPPGALQAVRVNLTAAELKLVDKDLAAIPEPPAAAPGVSGSDSRTLQKTYGLNNPICRRAIRKKLRLSSAVCRIEGPHNGEIKGIGSGFAVRGDLLHEGWGEAPVIVTNNHVISSRGAMGGRRPEFCRAVFIADNDEQEEAVKFASVLWESDVEAHDVTILKPAGPLPAGVVPLTELMGGSLGPRAQNDEGIGRCYVIGFPNARELSFSLADNILLDHDAPPECSIVMENGKRHCHGVSPLPVRVHYRTPTVEGNSGSPVFDADTISLLGVHHSGDREMRRLNNRGGTYAANEGIWIDSIRQAIASSYADGGAEASADMPRWWAFPNDTVGRAPKPAEDPGELVVPASAAKPMQIEGGGGEPMPGVSPFAAELIYPPGPAKPEERRSAQLETVIGVDNRTRILDTQMSPWRMVCAIRARWGSRLMVGTGCFIGPDTVLTAGHVVFTREFQRTAPWIEVIPGLSIDRAGVEKRPYENAMARAVHVHEQWMTSFSPRFDVAVIKLDKPLGQRVGWFGVESRARENLVNHWAHVSGYPGEMKEERPKGATADLAPQIASQLWHHAAPIEQVENGRMFYKTDTTPGQSGAPVYMLPAERQFGSPLVVGVHAYGARSTPGAMGLANSGVWIDGALFEKIRGWRG